MAFTTRNLTAALILCGWMTLSVSSVASPLRFSKNIPNDQKNLLQKDLEQFQNQSAKETDAEFQIILGLKESVTPARLVKWLEERVRFIVSEKFDLLKSVRFSRSQVHYPFPELVPDPVLALEELQAENDLMSDEGMNLKNLSGPLYTLGKLRGQKVTVQIPGQGAVVVRSPRVGLIQAGEGLFKGLRGSLDLRSPENVFIRLERLFHEARHSDGNGKNVGFGHNFCPPGHIYAGAAVCDFSRNGAYAVSAYWGKYFTENCGDCTVGQKEAMRLYYLDSYSRILSEKVFEENKDDVLPALLAAKESCDYYQKVVGTDEANMCANIEEQIQQAREGKNPTEQAQYLDNETESLR